MNPYHHAETSVRLFGGQAEDYQPLHDWMDDTKRYYADFRHRALRHHSAGIFEGEAVFGNTIVNSSGRNVPVRLILEQHVREDCGGRIPTVADWLGNIRAEVWMNRGYPVEKKVAAPVEGAAPADVPVSVLNQAAPPSVPSVETMVELIRLRKK